MMSRKILALLAFLHFNLLIYAQSPEMIGMPGLPGPLMPGRMTAGLNDLGQPGDRIFDGGKVNKAQQEGHSMLGYLYNLGNNLRLVDFPFPHIILDLGHLPHGKIPPSGQTPTKALPGTTTTFVTPM